MSSYVCAFRGRRDSYQVPLALAEAGLLDHFITDAYAGPWLQRLASLLPERLRSKVAFRHIEGIPGARVRCLWRTTLREHWRHRRGHAPDSTYLLLDRRYSDAAAKRARHSQANLLLYSSYAWEAFRANYSHLPRRVLFQYHPHPDVEASILTEDRMRFASIFKSDGPETSPPLIIAPGDRDAWRMADLVICASSFTRDSLLSQGLDPEKCKVVPYGIDLPATIEMAEPTTSPNFRALFVGSGVQRKGLHHLLLAWKSATLPPGARLTLVCRNIDEPLANLARSIGGVDFIPGISAMGLSRLYASSHLFVMPSLVEGFGQVFLEALVQGCPVLGTPNTCLPDLGGEESGIFVTPAGEIDALVEKLESLSRFLPENPGIRKSARALATERTWPRFRHCLIATLNGSTSTP